MSSKLDKLRQKQKTRPRTRQYNPVADDYEDFVQNKSDDENQDENIIPEELDGNVEETVSEGEKTEEKAEVSEGEKTEEKAEVSETEKTEEKAEVSETEKTEEKAEVSETEKTEEKAEVSETEKTEEKAGVSETEKTEETVEVSEIEKLEEKSETDNTVERSTSDSDALNSNLKEESEEMDEDDNKMAQNGEEKPENAEEVLVKTESNNQAVENEKREQSESSESSEDILESALKRLEEFERINNINVSESYNVAEYSNIDENIGMVSEPIEETNDEEQIAIEENTKTNDEEQIRVEDNAEANETKNSTLREDSKPKLKKTKVKNLEEDKADSKESGVRKDTEAILIEDAEEPFYLHNYELSQLTTWGMTIDENVLLSFDYFATMHDIKRYDLINSIVQMESEWAEQHPEFPEKSFVIENLKKFKTRRSLKVKTDGYASATMVLTKANKRFIEKQSKKCGMPMYGFLEYVITKYLGNEL